MRNFQKNFINSSMLLRKDLIRGNLQLPQDLNYLSNELHVIGWHGSFKKHSNQFPTKQTCGIENALQWHLTTMKRKYGKILSYANVHFISFH